MTISVAKLVEAVALGTPSDAEAAGKFVEHVTTLPPPGNAVDVAKLIEHIVVTPSQTGVIRVLLPPAELQFCDADGHPFAGGTLEMYVVGTTTPKDTWKDSGGLVLNTNPIVLDAAGRALIYGDGGYRTILRDADGNLIWDQPSFTYVSSAMAPVVGAATLEDARDAMGVTAAIQVETDRALAAEAAEVATRAAADTALGVRIDTETAARIAGDAHLQAQINALPPPAVASNVQGGHAESNTAGYVRVTFPVPFTTACLAFTCTLAGTSFVSDTFVATADRFGADVWVMFASSPIPKHDGFYWMAVGD